MLILEIYLNAETHREENKNPQSSHHPIRTAIYVLLLSHHLLGVVIVMYSYKRHTLAFCKKFKLHSC